MRRRSAYLPAKLRVKGYQLIPPGDHQGKGGINSLSTGAIEMRYNDSAMQSEFDLSLLQEPSPSSTVDEEAACIPSSSIGPSVVPSIGALPVFRSSSALTPVVCDHRAISTLLELILIRGKVSLHEQARRLGVSPNSVRQYLSGRRSRPSLAWFIRFANMAGAKVTIEFPDR